MKITDLTTPQKPITHTTSDVPTGQVFRGTIVSPDAGRLTGVFYKAHGAWHTNDAGAIRCYENVIVRLDGVSPKGYANLILRGHPIENYEPLDATLFLTRP